MTNFDIDEKFMTLAIQESRKSQEMNEVLVGAAFASFFGIFIYSLVIQYITISYMSAGYRKFIFAIYLVVFIIE